MKSKILEFLKRQPKINFLAALFLFPVVIVLYQLSDFLIRNGTYLVFKAFDNVGTFLGLVAIAASLLIKKNSA